MAKKQRAAIERNSRKILVRLKQEGWSVINVEGSHHKLAHPAYKHKIILVHPKKDLPIGTTRQIHRAAGWL